MSLKRRFLLLLLVPVTASLLTVGIGGFFFIQQYLLDQWSNSTQLKLEAVAHEIGMRLNEKLQLIDLIVRAVEVPDQRASLNFLLEQLRKKDGVRSVELGQHNMTQTEKANSTLWTILTMVPDYSENVLKIVRVIPGEGEDSTTLLIVKVDLSSFLAHIHSIELWKGSSACLVTSNGSYLAHTDPSMHDRIALGESGDPLEKRVLSSMRARTYGTIFGPGYPPDVVMGFNRVPSTDWYVILFSKGSTILEPMIRFGSYYVLIAFGAIALVFGLIRSTTGSVARSVTHLSSVAARIGAGDYTVKLPEARPDEIGYLNRSFKHMIEGLRQRDILQGVFGRYVDTSVAIELMRRTELLRMGGEERIVTILMADLVGFTEIAAEFSPEEVVRVLNSYLSRMIGVISSHGGIIVDFFGAGILAFFDGEKTGTAERAAEAVRCALEMRNGFHLLREDGEALEAAQITIGIHTGSVIVGNIGAETRTKYGIVGSGVNLTQRIKSAAYPGSIVVSEETYQILKQRLVVGPRIKVMLKGLEHSRDLFPVESLSPKAS